MWEDMLAFEKMIEIAKFINFKFLNDVNWKNRHFGINSYQFLLYMCIGIYL